MIRKVLLGLFLLPATLVASCALLPHSRNIPFNEEEYAPYAYEGQSSISGKAFIKMVDGSLIKCTGCTVVLTPATHYSTEWFERYVIAGLKLEKEDSNAYKYRKETVGDSDGGFTFDRLPAGDYYIVCQITAPLPGKPGKTTEAWAYSKGKLHLEAGEYKKVTLTNWHSRSLNAP